MFRRSGTSESSPIALRKAAASFGSAAGQRRAVIYIGDGKSTAQLITDATFHGLINSYVESKIPLSETFQIR